MNLLVTNTHNAQAYAIIRALRPHAEKIVVTMEGENRLAARFSHAANSRLVDRRYYTPSPAGDWRAGRIQKENTEREEAYIQAVFEICRAEKIDTIFPSFDPHVYVFSKNKERFEKIGVLLPIPDYETVITPLDKYRTIQAACEVGFPCPKTYLPEDKDDLGTIVEQVGLPLVIKPRFSSSSRGIEMVKSRLELAEKMRKAKESYGLPLVQEYIPGRERPGFNVLLDRSGGVKVACSTKRWRNFLRLAVNYPTARESVTPPSYVTRAAMLLHHLGWWGGAAVQTKIDARDGIPKLMEINPRLGYRLWEKTELGINVPLMALQIAKRQSVDALRYPTGILLLDPIEDILGLGFKLLDLLIYKIRVGIFRTHPLDPLNPPMSVKKLVSSYKETYFGPKRKVYNPYFRHFFSDPLVSILWWFQFFTITFKSAKELGK